MSVSQDNTLEINMIRDIINNSNRGKKTIENLLKSFDMLIKVADQIIDYKDFTTYHLYNPRPSGQSNTSEESDTDDDESYLHILIHLSLLYYYDNNF